jgi:hypothetical protein
MEVNQVEIIPGPIPFLIKKKGRAISGIKKSMTKFDLKPA